jgi:hypothetical protein
LILLRRNPPEFLKRFFTEVTAPINLAIFRMVLFAAVLSSFTIETVRWFGGLPKKLQFAPSGLGIYLQGESDEKDLRQPIAGMLISWLLLTNRSTEDGSVRCEI